MIFGIISQGSPNFTAFARGDTVTSHPGSLTLSCICKWIVDNGNTCSFVSAKLVLNSLYNRRNRMNFDCKKQKFNEKKMTQIAAQDSRSAFIGMIGFMRSVEKKVIGIHIILTPFPCLIIQRALWSKYYHLGGLPWFPSTWDTARWLLLHLKQNIAQLLCTEKNWASNCIYNITDVH